MAEKSLWDLIPSVPGTTLNHTMCDYTAVLAAELFPDDSRLAVYGALAGRTLFWGELDGRKDPDQPVIPEQVGSGQLQDWLAGQIVRGGLNMQRELARTTSSSGTYDTNGAIHG